MLSHFSSVQLFATLWTVARQFPLSMGLILQAGILEWVAMPSPPGDLPDPGMESMSLMSPVLAGGFFITSTTWKAHILFISCGNYFHSLLKITQNNY